VTNLIANSCINLIKSLDTEAENLTEHVSLSTVVSLGLAECCYSNEIFLSTSQHTHIRHFLLSYSY